MARLRGKCTYVEEHTANTDSTSLQKVNAIYVDCTKPAALNGRHHPYNRSLRYLQLKGIIESLALKLKLSDPKIDIL